MSYLIKSDYVVDFVTDIICHIPLYHCIFQAFASQLFYLFCENDC